MPSRKRKFSNHCSRDSRGEPVWGFRSCIRLCRRITAASVWFRSEKRARSPSWNCPASRKEPMQATKTTAKEPARGIAAHILVVDDEKSICELLEITFRKEGHRIEVAHNVEAAKRKL